MSRRSFRGAALLPSPGGLRLVPDALVEVEGGRIVRVRPDAREAGAGGAVALRDSQLLAPGFVDTHTHLKMQAIAAGVFERREDDTTTRRIARYDGVLQALGEEDVQAAVAEAAASHLAAGITTAWTRSYFTDMAVALAGRGPRLAVGRTLRAGPDLDKRRGKAFALARAPYGPEAPFLPTFVLHEAGLPFDDLRAVAQTAARHPDGPLPIQAHVAQRSEERDELGESAVKLLERAGLLQLGSFVAVHCVYLDDADLETLARWRVPVTYCPEATRRAGVGNPCVALRGRVPLLIGTDTPPFHMGRNLLTAVARGGFTLPEAFLAATAEPARVLRLPTGAILEGNLADLAVWDLGEPARGLDVEAAVAGIARAEGADATYVGGKELASRPEAVAGRAA